MGNGDISFCIDVYNRVQTSALPLSLCLVGYRYCCGCCILCRKSCILGFWRNCDGSH